MFQVVVRRIFMEGMIYDQVTSQRFTFLLRIKKLAESLLDHVCKIRLLSLWCVTIVGIAVKRYSYYLVPYIAAENPSMKANEAITLSRKMMDGHKWECFVLSFPLSAWQILGIFTMGLFNVFYTNPYMFQHSPGTTHNSGLKRLKRRSRDQNFCTTLISMRRLTRL